MIHITPATTPDHIEQMITLSNEYVMWMLDEVRQRYPAINLNNFAADHSYHDIRKKYPGEHVPPHGAMFLATADGELCGCVALGKRGDGICEMRTLFVRPAYRGTGAGKRLVEAVLSEARRLGYKLVRLDTLAFMTGAQTLYRSYGFRDIEPYFDIPDLMQPYLRFFQCDLAPAAE